MTTSPLNRALLFAPAKLYELGVRIRIALYQTEYKTPRRLSAPTISVGNITLGGTGKTPLVAFLAGYLRDEGYAVAVLSRGYKRRSRGRVEVSTDERVLVDAEAAGDEPFLLAQICPGVRVVVDADRGSAGAWLSERANISAFLLDDGFQHLQVARDLNFVLLDATDPIGGGEMVPFGRLREPLTGLARADAIIVTRADQSFDQGLIADTIASYCRANTPVFYAYHDLTQLRRLDREGQARPADFAYRRVAMLAGIAKPERFRADLEHFAIRIVSRHDFSDHHRYREDEFFELAASAQAAGAEAILTTEKDAMNLPEKALTSSSLPVFAAQIEFRCEDEVALKSLVLRTVNKKKRAN